MKNILLFYSLLLSFGLANAQAPSIQWKKCYGGFGEEDANVIIQTKDSGYIVAGQSNYNDGDVTGNHGDGIEDFWVVKLSPAGAIQWKKCYGGSGTDIAHSIQQTFDGGYIVAGSTTSPDGDVTGGFIPDSNHPLWGDYWIIKIDATGTLQWQKIMGPNKPGFGQAQSIVQTKDSGYIVVGVDYGSQANSGDFANGSVVKLSNTGSVQWQSFAMTYENSIKQTKDGGYIMAGGVSGLGFVLEKKDSIGNQQWMKFYGGIGGYDFANSVFEMKDGGYIAVGFVSDTGRDVTGFHGGYNDVWVVRTDSLGTLIWQKCYGGSGSDIGNSLSPTSDGGFVITATTNSHDGDVQNVSPSINNTNTNLWMFKIDSLGVLKWQKTMGGDNIDYATSMQQTIDGGYIVAGSVVSNYSGNNGDIAGTGFHLSPTCHACTGHDFFVVKLGLDPVTIPVLLTNFTAVLSNKNAQLNWQTSSEISNKNFEVQRSSDGISFTTIAIINGNGTTSLPHSYSFTDINFMQQGRAYYRLKQVDLDGKFTYSKVVYLQASLEGFNVDINPNPATTSFTLSIPAGFNDVWVTIYDNAGTLIRKQICNSGQTIFDINNWQACKYSVKLICRNGTIVIKKIIVVR